MRPPSFSLAALLALTACDTGSGPAPPMGSRLRLLETIPGAAFRLSVDGRVVNANFHFGTLTPAIVVLPGQHTLSGQSLSDTSSFRSEEHTSELQSLTTLVCRLLLEI